jgi:hypothetical protein
MAPCWEREREREREEKTEENLWMIVIHMDRLASYQGAARDERP